MCTPTSWLSYIDPNEDLGGIRPTTVKKGIYRFKRDPYDSDIVIVDPEGNSYIFGYFEFERILKSLFKLNEDALNRLVDMVWDFYSVVFNSVTGRFWSDRVADIR